MQTTNTSRGKSRVATAVSVAVSVIFILSAIGVSNGNWECAILMAACFPVQKFFGDPEMIRRDGK